MLSDRDRETLREVERQFLTEDPGLARSFTTVESFTTVDQWDLLRWLTAVPRWAYTAAIVVAVLLGVLMIAARAPGIALVFAAMATLVSMARRRRDDDAPERS